MKKPKPPTLLRRPVWEWPDDAVRRMLRAIFDDDPSLMTPDELRQLTPDELGRLDIQGRVH